MTGRYTLKRSEMLKSAKDFERLFNKNQRVYSVSAKGVSARFFRVNEQNEPPFKVAFLVGKRWIRVAVRRNLVKRRLREAFRLQRNALNDIDGIRLAIIYRRNNVMGFDEIFEAMSELLVKVNERLD